MLLTEEADRIISLSPTLTCILKILTLDFCSGLGVLCSWVSFSRWSL